MDKLSQLKIRLFSVAKDNRLAVAFSGGVDSRFLAFFAQSIGLTPLLLIVKGPHFAAYETTAAKKEAENLRLPYKIINFDSAVYTAMAQAGKDRCYVCKKSLMATLLAAAGDLPLCDGTHASDKTVFRPGLKALRELYVHSPLAESEITKSDIRAFAKKLGMPNPEQAARPCLFTRFPYGAIPNEATLKLVANVEEFLSHEPFLAGKNFRLRFPANTTPLLHIEGSPTAQDSAEFPALKKRLISRFGLSFKPLHIEKKETLSGFYDKEKR